MQCDRVIKISAAGNRRATHWPAQSLLWSEFIARLQTPARSTETLAVYMGLSRGRQDDLKDVGGYVGGMLRGDRRKANAVLQRDLITLDLDNIPAGGTDDALRRIDSLGCAYVVYSTRKHEPYKPRLRAVLLLDGPCSADEYEPIARICAQRIGLELCDPTTFQASRLMYWPSCCADGQYVYFWRDYPQLSRQGVLGLYKDWRDINTWPRVPGEEKLVRHADKLGDPTTKEGVVGAFCRSYDIYRAIEELIPAMYTPTEIPDRYSYAGGSTSGGAVVYDNGLFLYSHHATDPCSMREVNAFDLVRLHLYGEMDDDAQPNTPVNKLPSYTAMCEYALKLDEVAAALNQDRYLRAAEAFGLPSTSPVPSAEPAAGVFPEAAPAGTVSSAGDLLEWMKKLEINSVTGAIAKTVDNVVIILENDPYLAGKVMFDEFSQRAFIVGSLPWRAWDGLRHFWSDKDDSQLIRYIEKVYRITGDQKIGHGMKAYLDSHAINEVKQYLGSLRWDGAPRLESLFIDYLGAADTPYTRAVTRKSLCAAIARVYNPGCKYDYVPVLYGGQGIGKTTVLNVLGGVWHSDSLDTFDGKEAAELVQGVWIVELGELTALARSEENAAKHFISKREDQYRVPYERQTSVFPRRCVFFGTTNRKDHLRDTTGNRRWWPIDCNAAARCKNPWHDLPRERDQIWAEAMTRWQIEPLYLDNDLEAQAQLQQQEHMEIDPRLGLVAEWLERPMPLDWYIADKWSIEARANYWASEFGRVGANSGPTIKRGYVAPIEIWVECFHRDKSQFNNREAAEIGRLMETMPGWARHSSSFRNGAYGYTRGFVRA